MFVEEAREAVSSFLKKCLAHEFYCVRIIHGKGNGSPQGLSVLREKVRRWLKQRDEVVGALAQLYFDGTEAPLKGAALAVFLTCKERVLIAKSRSEASWRAAPPGDEKRDQNQ